MPKEISNYMSSALKHSQNHAKRPRFWLGPFVAGCCIAFGYGLTSRLIGFHEAVPKKEMTFLNDEAFPYVVALSYTHMVNGSRRVAIEFIGPLIILNEYIILIISVKHY